MRDYTITCESGTVALVRAASVEAAEAAWDEQAEAGDAEPRIAGTTELASRDEIERCVAMGHDYR